MKTKLLFTTLPTNDLGLLTRSLPIATELRNAGHNILFSSPAKAPRILIEQAGFRNTIPKHPLYYINSGHVTLNALLELVRSPKIKNDFGHFSHFLIMLLRSIPRQFAPITAEVWNMDHGAAMSGMLSKNFVQSQCDAYVKMILENEIDVVVDFWNPFACIAARTLARPLVTVIQADAHPGNNGFIWWKEKPANIPSATPTINLVLKDYGLTAISTIDELNIGDLTLVMGIRETDPIENGNDFHYIGPVLWQNPDETMPEWMDQFDKQKPLIWVYSGNPRYLKKSTALDSEVILHACVKVLGREQVNVVLTTGHHTLPEEFLPLPDNFQFASYLPGLDMAERCDLMIHHGGYGSCQTSLYTGTPSVIIPTFSERESNARRLHGLGVCEFVLPTLNSDTHRELNIHEFRTKIRQVLSTSLYRENAIKYRDMLRAWNGPQKAAKLIQDFVDNL
ncbi:hypothetical protein JW960_17735 [candidate division KSB1 bacterium]|nr:hypothetical protein [candidate division KSB1 bacterium]